MGLLNLPLAAFRLRMKATQALSLRLVYRALRLSELGYESTTTISITGLADW